MFIEFFVLHSNCTAIFKSVGSLKNVPKYIFINYDNVQSVKNYFVRTSFEVSIATVS